MKINHILLLLGILFYGCKSSAEHDAKVAQEARAELIAEIEANRTQTQKQTIWENAGITKKNQTITIDLNRTKNFIQDTTAVIAMEAIEITQEIKTAQEKAIHVTKDTIQVDLNQTKSLFDSLQQKVDALKEQLEVIMEDLEDNTTSTQKDINDTY